GRAGGWASDRRLGSADPDAPCFRVAAAGRWLRRGRHLLGHGAGRGHHRPGAVMELALSPEQEEIRKLVSELAGRAVRPRAEAIDQSGEFPLDLVLTAADHGMLAHPVQLEYAGPNPHHISFAI